MELIKSRLFGATVNENSRIHRVSSVNSARNVRRSDKPRSSHLRFHAVNIRQIVREKRRRETLSKKKCRQRDDEISAVSNQRTKLAHDI